MCGSSGSLLVSRERSFLFNWTPFARPDGVSYFINDKNRTESTEGQKYMERRHRFHFKVFGALAILYFMQLLI